MPNLTGRCHWVWCELPAIGAFCDRHEARLGDHDIETERNEDQ